MGSKSKDRHRGKQSGLGMTHFDCRGCKDGLQEECYHEANVTKSQLTFVVKLLLCFDIRVMVVGHSQMYTPSRDTSSFPTNPFFDQM